MPTIINPSNQTDVQYISVYDCIASACRQGGMLDSDITPAILGYGKLRLNLILQNLTNRSIPLFLIQRVTIGLGLNQTQYVLPQYVFDLLNVMWRRTEQTGYVASGGVDPQYLNTRNWFEYATTTNYFQFQINNPKVDSVGLLFYGNQTVTLTIQGSTDGITWQTLNQYPTQEYFDGIWLWVNYNPSYTINYLKVTCANTETLSLRSFYVCDLTSANEVVLTRINRDTYTAIPNKQMPMSPINYYFDRQISPVFNLWGAPVDVYDWALNITWQVQFENVGALTNQLAIPYYFLDAVISELASRLILELPKDKIDMTRYNLLRQKSTDDLNIAESSQEDLDNISLIPNLSAYSS